MANQDIQLSDAERRLLRKVFHRHALPYLVLMLAVTAMAVLGGRSDETEVSEAAAPPPLELAALQTARVDAEALVAELAAAAAGQKTLAATAASELASLEKGIETATRRLRDLEIKTRNAQKRLDEVASAPAPEAAQTNLSAILERLSSIEVRQDQAEAGGANLADNSRSAREIFDRLALLEQAAGSSRSAARSGAPAAPASLP